MNWQRATKDEFFFFFTAATQYDNQSENTWYVPPLKL